MWDTGLTDAIFSAPSSDPSAWKRKTTLAGELEKLGVKPVDVKYVAVSHTHPDHIGSVELSPESMLVVQKAEYDWPNQDGSTRFKPSHPVKKLEGDYDMLDDGSVCCRRMIQFAGPATSRKGAAGHGAWARIGTGRGRVSV